MTPALSRTAALVALAPFACDRAAEPPASTESTAAVAPNSKRENSKPEKPWPPGMVWIPEGEFTMGGVGPEARPDDFPLHRVRVDGFWMDETEVTNRQFRAFVDATHYVTTAEKKPDWEEMKRDLPPGTEKPDDSQLVPGAMIFVPTDGPVPLDDWRRWWTWKPGADWRHTFLPANLWQGAFPCEKRPLDGFLLTAPVRSFPPNRYGLYDVIGNVWEWCSDWYRADYFQSLVDQSGAQGVADNPQGPSESLDPEEPYCRKRVNRGGSFLCNCQFCASYRPSARMKTAPDSGQIHLGFRAAMSDAAWRARLASAQKNAPTGR